MPIPSLRAGSGVAAAIDGNTGNAAATTASNNPWMSFQLPASSAPYSGTFVIKIFALNSWNWIFLSAVRVRLSWLSSPTSGKVCAFAAAAATQADILSITCSAAMVQWVHIQRIGTNVQLGLAEVQLFRVISIPGKTCAWVLLVSGEGRWKEQ